MSKHHTRENKTVLLLIPDNIDNIYIKKNVADVRVNFYDKSKFENNVIHKSKNGVDWVFNVNENKHKNLHCISDDDDYDLTTCDTFTINKILYADNTCEKIKKIQ